MKASYRFPAFDEPAYLIANSSWCRIIVVVEMRDYVPRRLFAAMIPLRSNLKPVRQVDQSDSRIPRRNQVAYVQSVREDQQFAMRICLVLETLDRLRQPYQPIPRQAEAGYERRPAEPPPGPEA